MKFFQTAAIIAGTMGLAGYIAHQQSPAFRRIPLPAKMITLGVCTLGPSYWVSEKQLMRCHRPDYDIGRRWR